MPCFNIASLVNFGSTSGLEPVNLLKIPTDALGKFIGILNKLSQLILAWLPKFKLEGYHHTYKIAKQAVSPSLRMGS